MRLASRDWQDLLDKVERVAVALEKIAKAQAARASEDATAERVAGDLNTSANALRAALPPSGS